MQHIENFVAIQNCKMQFNLSIAQIHSHFILLFFYMYRGEGKTIYFVANKKFNKTCRI